MLDQLTDKLIEKGDANYQGIEESKNYHFETFMEAELLVNITKHRYVPRHQVLSSKEKATLLKK